MKTYWFRTAFLWLAMAACSGQVWPAERALPPSPGAAAAGSIRLMGVVAASGERPGHAVLRLDAKKTVAVLQGEDVEPGLRLAEVHVDHVVLERNGARETLAWPEKK